jgi:predicted ATPase
MNDGIRQLRQGLSDWQATGSATYRTYYLALLAETLARAGKHTEAQTVLDEALALVEKTDERFFESELHRLRGELLLKGLDPLSLESAVPAKAAFHQAIDISRRQEAKSLLLRAVTSLVRLEQQLDDAAESQKLLSETLASFTQGKDTRDLNEAIQMLQPNSP